MLTNKELLMRLDNQELAKILAAYCGRHSCRRCPFYDSKKWASICPGTHSVLEWACWLEDEIYERDWEGMQC